MEELFELKEGYDSLPDYSMEELESFSEDTLIDYYEMRKEAEEFKRYHKLLYFKPDEWLFKLHRKMVDQTVCSIIASNRSGKSYSSTWALACHLTGIYPPFWKGMKYDTPIDTWIMCPTAENYTQEGGLQEYMLGKEENGVGWIPKEAIVSTETGQGTKGFIKKVYVRHVSGGVSTMEFKSYSQGFSVLQGASIDLILIDEEPKDQKILGECITRLMQAPSGKGRILLSFTPTNGMTETVTACFEGKWKAGCERITVWDVSFITPEKIEEMKNAYREGEWDLRLKGIPAIGQGAVYPLTERELTFYDGEIEIQPHWRVAAAIDFGYLPDECCVLFGAINPDNGRYHVFKEFYHTEKHIPEIAGWIKSQAPNIPVIYPADGNRKQQAANGKTYQEMFYAEGVDMRLNYRVDYGRDGERETGHTAIRNLMRSGLFLVKNTCTNWFKEYRIYQYDNKGSTTHCVDHAMDATRYLVQKLETVGIPWSEAQRSGPSSYNRFSSKKSTFKNVY